MTVAARTAHHPTDRAQRRAARREAEFRQQAAAVATLASLPEQHRHAAGIDVGDTSTGSVSRPLPMAPTPSASSPPTPTVCASSSPG